MRFARSRFADARSASGHPHSPLPTAATMPAMAVWQCASCGGENPDGMRFCGHCGSPADATAKPATSAPSAPPPPADDAEEEREAALTAFASDRIDPGGAGMTEERRLITAMFADLSGFTPLSEKLDAEELLEVIDPIITALSNLVGRYGGYVEKFAGDALLALFGAPIAHEDDATRAIQVSIEMHEELARLRQTMGENGEGLTLHIGIASGRGIARMIGSKVRMDYAVLGDSVILAQRLESATPSGQTYVSEATHELAQDRFEMVPVPPLTLKGKAEPVPAWRLMGVRASKEQRSGLVGRRHAPLVGRDHELAVGRSTLDRLVGGQGTGILAVVGEPGVGKSRLTEEIRGAAGGLGIDWMEARCLSYGAGLAYWPFLDLLRRELGIEPDAPCEAATERLSLELERLGVAESAPFIARLIGIASPAELEDLEPEALRRGLHDAIREWLRARAAHAPTMLAIEDAHWADPSSSKLIEELSTLSADAPIGFYLTSRPPMPSWLGSADIDREAVATLEIGQLDLEAIGRLVDHVIDGRAPWALGEMVADRSAGNPFFAQEIVRSLQDAGTLYQEGGTWRLRSEWNVSDVPATIEGVLAARLDGLPASAQGTLAVASVIGRRVAVALLERVTGEPAITGRDVEQLLTAGMLDPVAGTDAVVMFHHALIGDVAYGRLLRRRRRELHRRTAEAAEALYGTNDESIELLARHLYLGEGGPRAIDYLMRAAERAERLFANEEAIIHLRRAEELASGPEASERLLDIRLDLGDLQELIGAYEDAQETYQRILERESDVRAWRGLSSVHRVRGEYHEAMRVLDDAFSRPELASQDLRPLWLERGWNRTSAEAMGDAIAALREGLAVREDASDPMAGQLLIELARAESYAGSLHSALEHAQRALAIAQQHKDLRAETTALRVLGLVQQSLGQLEEAAASLRRDLELARRIGSVEAIGGALINLGLVERDRGNMAEAIVCDRGAIEIFERVQHGAGRAIGYANLADKLRRAGELEEAEAFAHRAHDLAEEIDHAMTRADSVQILGEISLARGDHEEAAHLAESSAELFLAADANPGAAEAFELAERAWRAAGNENRATESAARVRELSEIESA